MSIYTNLRRKHPKGKVDVVLLNLSRLIEFVLGVYLSKDYLEYFSKKGVKKVFRNLGGRGSRVENLNHMSQILPSKYMNFMRAQKTCLFSLQKLFDSE